MRCRPDFHIGRGMARAFLAPSAAGGRHAFVTEWRHGRGAKLVEVPGDCVRSAAVREQALLAVSIKVTILTALLGVLFGILSGSLAIAFDGVYSVIDASISGLALIVAKLLQGDGNRRFQHGYWHIEPLVLAFNGGIITLLCFYALINALISIREGGRDLAFDWAIAYTLMDGVLCVAMYAYQRHHNRSIGSDLVRLDMQGWLMAATISVALVLAFGAAWAIQGTAHAPLARYADSAILALLALCMLPIPIRTVMRAWSEILLITPRKLDKEIRRIVARVVDRHGLGDFTSYVAKVGRARFIEVQIIVPDGHQPDDVASQDIIRHEIAVAIGGAGPQLWLTVSFTRDRRWL